ncbi:MAG: tRNA (adenosine(37)-N6)-threonylcarbamoyltransferase complex dimerization subunit type 1 TsaB [Flavobacteriales bacterium]|nr:tRNA (adenosine(37)-N6)-threonylcarbamoyltransferase complex dimerization subunit type 1 TsaB [Flavobacteriales bacterium]
MPLILCIETATKLCSVALARNGVVLAARDLESDKHVHAEKVNVFIAEVMQEAGLALKDLNAVAVGIGPGSYTGLRIGLSAAKGLCYALGVPIIGIGTLRTLHDAARSVQPSPSGEVWPMIDARRMEVFTQKFDVKGNGIGEAAPAILDEAWTVAHAPATVFGDGADKAAALWSGAVGIAHIQGIRPFAAAMAQEAEKRFAQGAFDDVAYLVPTYGKAANVTQPKKRTAP